MPNETQSNSQYLLVGPLTQCLPMTDLSLKGSLQDENLNVLKNVGILCKGKKIIKIADFEELKTEASLFNAQLFMLEDNYVCIPGLIDAHTHICFMGSRANDYAMRNAGKSYLEIANTGGGIWDTVTQTRKASLEELAIITTQRATSLLEAGITTIEVKSGYGLSIQEELKILRAIQMANQKVSADLISTCLAAHIVPKDYTGTAKAYLNEISTSLFPVLLQEKLTHRIDAFIEKSAFTQTTIKPYLVQAKAMGFDLTVHADQFTTGGSEIAIEFEALSADHLEASTEKEIKSLANSNVIAVALPGASIGLGCNFTPARRILDAGGGLAIASDWNPGSAPMGDLLLQACILGTFQKLTNAELLAGMTYRAAAALNLDDRGTLAPNALADFNLFKTNHFNEIFYHQGKLKPTHVFKNGKPVKNNVSL
ncbi:imidazolonepropionase [Aquimarina sp. W85]|uniref:imidazolonepropionase n=1 Tax=Aquimarina rhodophyticola TaxID=3342246 RepID=UPI00367169B2